MILIGTSQRLGSHVVFVQLLKMISIYRAAKSSFFILIN
jgi:hypothetical protein